MGRQLPQRKRKGEQPGASLGHTQRRGPKTRTGRAALPRPLLAAPGGERRRRRKRRSRRLSRQGRRRRRIGRRPERVPPPAVEAEGEIKASQIKRRPRRRTVAATTARTTESPGPIKRKRRTVIKRSGVLRANMI